MGLISKYKTSIEHDRQQSWDGLIDPPLYAPWFIKIIWLSSILLTLFAIWFAAASLGLITISSTISEHDGSDGLSGFGFIILVSCSVTVFWTIYTTIAKLATYLQAKLTGQPVGSVMPKVQPLLSAISEMRKRMFT